MQRLQAGAASGTHPDPNLISAFVENSLPRDARAQVMQHVAQCADCREVVFLSTPDQVANSTAALAPKSWLAWPVLRWSAAVAAIVVVGAAVSLHRQSGDRSSTSDAVRMTDTSIAKQQDASAPSLDEKQRSATLASAAPAAPVVADGAVPAAENRLSAHLKKQAAPALTSKTGSTTGDLADQRRDELDKSTTVDATAQSVAVAAEGAQVVPGRAKDSASEPAPITGGGVAGGVATNAAPAARSGPLMFAPSIAPRWTLTADGALQRSFDLGRSWQNIQVAPQASFRALAANGKDIWVGGAKGALYHSTDAGQNWAHVQPIAAGKPLTDDIIGVEFPDLLHGKLTTADNEIWTTDDGGQTWRQP
jgi:Photosynthesis system II assembly factor YCF48/Putative zinc-finger